jgi:hypothetical protein
VPRLRIAYLGDIVGRPGREAFAAAAPRLRTERRADVIVVNAENARHGRGLHPDGYAELRRAGADAITLGDHAMDDERIATHLAASAEPICLPINWRRAGVKVPEGAARWVRLPVRGGGAAAGGGGPPVVVLSVLGRVFMPLEVDDPFDAVDAAVRTIMAEHADALVIVEIHCEATSEKAAMAWHCLRTWPRRVVAVVGTHTHVQTADARQLTDETGAVVAAMTDLGMCGAHEGVIGFDAQKAIVRVREQRGQMTLAEGGRAACGAMIVLDTDAREASIQTLRLDAE